MIYNKRVLPPASGALKLILIEQFPMIASVPKLAFLQIHWSWIVSLRSIWDLVAPEIEASRDTFKRIASIHVHVLS